MNNQEQITYWNGEAGDKWVQNANQLDTLLAPFIPEILARAVLQPGEHVLDIGCGAGALTLKAAAEVGDQRGAIGVDVSKPLLTLARHRAETEGFPASFLHEDASQYRAAQPVDAAISRFGVMFFSDPAVAFESLRRNLRPEGRLVFASWQGLENNGWASFALQAAMPYLSSPLPQSEPNAPGPFAFADRARVENLLTESGWHGVNLEPWSGNLRLPGDTPAEGADFLLKMGPLSRVLAEQNVDMPTVRSAVISQLDKISASDGDIHLPAAAWIVSATAS